MSLFSQSVLVVCIITSFVVGKGRRIAGEDVPIYIGAGCFWHVQYEMIRAEREVLDRNTPESLTARTGYAGGIEQEGLHCYHNDNGIKDYGEKGDTEVVQVKIPASAVTQFAQKMFSKGSHGMYKENGNRHDEGDVGSLYRSALGLPGGVHSEHFSTFKAIAEASGFRLEPGEGNEGDTLDQGGLVYVYDTAKFPFFVGEIYHQFRDDFQVEAYGEEYNAMRRDLKKNGVLKETGCPEKIPLGPKQAYGW